MKVEFSTHDESDWKVTLADTGLNSMTGARIKKIKEDIGDGDFDGLDYNQIPGAKID